MVLNEQMKSKLRSEGDIKHTDNADDAQILLYHRTRTRQKDQARPISYIRALWQVGPASYNEIHTREMNLIDWTLLGRESADLVGSDDDIFALLLPRCSAD